jgi:site-specific recombinase XerD
MSAIPQPAGDDPQALAAMLRALLAKLEGGGPRLAALPTDPPTKRKRGKRKPKRLPRFLSEADAEKLLDAARREIEKYSRPYKRRDSRWVGNAKLLAAKQDYVIVVLALNTGLRISEWAALSVDHIDLAQRTLLVKEGKGCKDRMVPLNDKVLPVLRDWLHGVSSGPVFVSPSGERAITQTLYYRIIRLGRLAGLPRVSPHRLRHAFCTRLLERGVDLRTVMEAAGHSSLATTQIYLGVTPQRLSESINRL